MTSLEKVLVAGRTQGILAVSTRTRNLSTQLRTPATDLQTGRDEVPVYEIGRNEENTIIYTFCWDWLPFSRLSKATMIPSDRLSEPRDCRPDTVVVPGRF